MVKYTTIGAIGGFLLGAGISSFILPPADPKQHLDALLYVLTSIPKPLSGAAIVIGIVLIGVAYAWDALTKWFK